MTATEIASRNAGERASAMESRSLVWNEVLQAT
jgi:hypothetical protein